MEITESVILSKTKNLMLSMRYKTLHSVQSDTSETFARGSLKSNFEKLRTPSSELRTTNSKLRTPNSELRTINTMGFTLIEIVVVIVILSIVSTIAIYFLINSLKIYTITLNQKALLDEGKLAFERMCRDIRDAKSISSPAPGGSGSSITFIRSNATAQDAAGETITFRLTGSALEKVKSSPSAVSAMAANVSTFTVTRGAANDEITIALTLSLASGENMTLQTRVYPKNLPRSTTYKNFFQKWQERTS